MKVIDLDKDYSKNKIKNIYIGLGNFDGLHIAHQKIIKNLVKKSSEDHMKSAVLLFKEHTLATLNGNKPKIITSLNQKLDILNSLNVDYVFLVDFMNIKNLSPNEFIEKLLINTLDVKGVFVGYDYKFGKKAKGDVGTLREYKDNINVFIQDSVTLNNKVVSSTLIKELIINNRISEAEKFLGRPYLVEGIVVDGKKLGKKLGFPTANIKLLGNYVLPSEGVYDTDIFLENKKYKGATSLGKNMTFNEVEEKIEVHILNFNENIYGEKIEIHFLKKLREMIKFNSIDNLIHQMETDIEKVLENR